MDPLWIIAAFVFGAGSSRIGLPPLVGYLIAGFALNGIGVDGGEILSKIADIGVTLLLFTIGLPIVVSMFAGFGAVLLEQIFEDHPDANFLDVVLLKWVYVAYRMGNYQKANDKCTQLIFEYPASPHAKKAKQLLPAIEAELDKSKPAATGKKSGDAATGAAASSGT